MKKYMADFVVDSDLCIENDDKILSLMAPDNSFTLSISNITDQETVQDSVLSMQIVYDANDILSAKKVAEAIIIDVLNYLSYVTNRKFAFKAFKRIFDWTPGLAMRDALLFDTKPVWEYAEPSLDMKFIETVQILMGTGSGEAQQTAMRSYRLGIQAETLEDQFANFWFALEVASENLKTNDKIASKCPKCRTDLYCETCKTHPTHKRFRSEAIHQTIKRVHPTDADEIYDALSKIRHTLLHGKRIATIIEELPCNEEEAINKLAQISRAAIDLMFKEPDYTSSEAEEEKMVFGWVDNITRRRITATARIQTMLKGEHNNPQVKNLPNTEARLESVNPRKK